jgi:hypothetical protein
LAALDDLLECGDLEEWKPVIAGVGREPWSALAERVLHLVDQHPMYGTSGLWRSWIAARRAVPWSAPLFASCDWAGA